MVNFMDFKSIQGLLLMHYRACLIKREVHQRLIVIYIFMFSFMKFCSVATKL